MAESVHRAEAVRNWNDSASVRAIRRLAAPERKVRLRQLAGSEANPVSRKPGLEVAGVSRKIPDDTLAHGQWSTAPDGKRIWRVLLESPDADAIRVHFRNFQVGNGKVWLLGTDGTGDENTTGPYTGGGPFGDGEFWTDLVSGEAVTIAYEPAQPPGDSLPFEILEISHQFARKTGEVRRLAAAASCALDVTCFPEYTEPASAVALIVFQSGGESYSCSGALISSAAVPAAPFFLTANHCISTAEEARSVISVFNYQTSTCNGTRPPLSGLPRVAGATLVAGLPISQGDITLLRLTGFPNVDVKVLGWSADPIASNEQVIGISHPAGDYKRIAIGQRTRDVTIRFDDGERMPADVGYQVAWFQGVTQGGSSGSPLLATLGGKQFLVGTLTAGPDIDEEDDAAVCRARNLNASYGRFASAWPALSPWLTAVNIGSDPPGMQESAGAPALIVSERSGTRATLTWNAPAVSSVQIRIGSPSGPAMTGVSPPQGSAQTGDWVSDGMVFYLQDASTGDSAGRAKTLAAVRVAAPGQTPGIGMVTATPASITLAAGQTAASVTLSWQAYSVTAVQLRIGSPYGPAMSGLEPPAGSTSTGPWVTNSMTFYLQDASGGDSSGPARTIATVEVPVLTLR